MASLTVESRGGLMVPLSSCSDFEVAIEQRLHGSLPDEETAQLDEHLAGCDGCSAYLATASTSQQALVDISRSVVGEADWQAATARFQATLRGRRRRLGFGLIVLVLMAPFVAWAVASPEELLAVTVRNLLVGGAVLAASAARTMVTARRLTRLLDTAQIGDLFELQRTYLRGRVRVLRWTRILALPPFALLVACAAAHGLLRQAHGAYEAHGSLGLGVAAVIVAVGWVRLHFVELPRVRRELAELGPR
jgi:hypothetical protein